MIKAKPKILIIADDLTGAAELGGIAFNCGLSARILFDSEHGSYFSEDVIILDTNSRNMSPEEAYKEVKKLVSGIDLSSFDLVYKKVDSLLRGPIASEIKALLDELHVDQAYLVPANPSRNRIIHSGKYYIDDLPINKTNFRLDPHYPRTSKYVRDLIIDSSHTLITSNDPGYEQRIRILIPDMTSKEELQAFVANLADEPMLLAGASDFFREILSLKFNLQIPEEVRTFHVSESTHFLIGSNSESSRKTVRSLARHDYSIFRLPLSALEDNSKFHDWSGHILKEIENQRCIVISGPARRVEDPFKVKLIAEKHISIAKILLEKMPVNSLFLIEGGETSSMFFRAMEWHDFRISDAYETGVVSLSPTGCEIKIIIKPGSYQWPEYVLNPLKEIVHEKVK
ncbi:MAG: four-carbon acid sugar kinase family protein [Bacteroidales bacterium]|nr:four-carbon acid sugar kinase family protein [Bacteroidales bacterium]